MNAAAAAPKKPSDFTNLQRGLITVALVTGPIMQVLDSSMLAVAMRHMQGSLSAAQDQIAWVLTSYLIAVAVATPLWGALTEHFSRKRLFIFGLLGFTLISVLCGSADTLTEILVYRAMQGVFGAGLIPLSQSALMDVYEQKDYGVAMGWWGIGLMFGPILGPTLGGYVTEWYSWRWAFFINIPFGIFGIVLAAAMLPSTLAKKRRPFNYFGFAMLSIGLASLQFVLDRGQRMDWLESHIIIGLACIAGAAFWVFIVNSVYSKNPFVDPVLLTNRNFVIGMLLRMVFGLMLFGSLILIPPFVQNISGYSLVDSGLILAPRGLATMISAYIVGRLVKYYDARKLIAVGLSLAALSAWEMSQLTADSSVYVMIGYIMIQGVGFAFFFIPLTTASFSTMAADQRDLGTSIYALTGNIGRSIGIAVLSSFLVRQTQTNRAHLSEHSTPFNDLMAHVPMPDTWALDTTTGLAALEHTISFQASMLAYSFDFQLLTGILLCCLPLTMFMTNSLKVKKAVGA